MSPLAGDAAAASGADLGGEKLLTWALETVATGHDEVWLYNLFAESFTFEDVVASLQVASTSGAVSIEIEKCTKANLEGTPSWVSIFSTVVTIDANERSSEQAATPAVFGAVTFDDGDSLRMRVTGAGTGATGLFVGLKIGEIA